MADIIEGQGNQMQHGTLDWILEQKTDLSAKNGEIQIKPRVLSVGVYPCRLVIVTNVAWSYEMLS